MSKSLATFKACALASGLVSQEDLEAAEVAPRAAPPAPNETPERTLASSLVELGKINRWQADQLLEGRSKWTLGPYQVIDSLGQGGMGQVFKAEHTIMGRIVAVKVLPQHKSTPESVAAFNREVRTQAQLDHENLVRAHDAGQDGNVHFLVTEYVPGADLRKLVRSRGKLTMQMAASIISQAAKGLEYAHNRGLIHRDIKPANLLVTPEGRTKVSDLGLAAFFSEDDLDERKGKIVGTADYLAPEQILNPGSPTVSVDIYSLGCTLYYAVTGKVPFPGGTSRDKVRAHCTKQAVDPRRLNPELSADFSAVIDRLLAKDPHDRPKSAGEVMALLAPWVASDTHVVSDMVAAAASASASGIGRRAPPGAILGREPSFLVQPRREGGDDDSSNQSSLGTPSLHNDETTPMFADVQEFSELPAVLQGLIYAGSVAVLLLMAWAIATSLG